MCQTALKEIHHPDEFPHPTADRAAIQALGVIQLRDLALEHHRDAIRHDQSLFLVMGHKDKGNPHFALQFDQFNLHHLAHFFVQGRKRLIKKQNLRL